MHFSWISIDMLVCLKSLKCKRMYMGGVNWKVCQEWRDLIKRRRMHWTGRWGLIISRIIMITNVVILFGIQGDVRT